MPLDTPTQSGPPSAVFPTIGDSIVIGVVDVGEYHQKDYDNDQLKYWPNGDKVMGKVVTGLVVSTEGTTAKGNTKENHPVEPGDLVTFWCEGGKFFTYRDALKEAGMVDVGYVMKWWREADEPAKTSRHNDRKVYKARIRKPKPEEADLVARCMAAHDDLKREKALDAAPDEREPVSVSVSVSDDF